MKSGSFFLIFFFEPMANGTSNRLIPILTLKYVIMIEHQGLREVESYAGCKALRIRGTFLQIQGHSRKSAPVFSYMKGILQFPFLSPIEGVTCCRRIMWSNLKVSALRIGSMERKVFFFFFFFSVVESSEVLPHCICVPKSGQKIRTEGNQGFPKSRC